MNETTNVPPVEEKKSEPQVVNAEVKPSSNSQSQIDLSSLFTKEMIRAGVVGGVILGALSLVGSLATIVPFIGALFALLLSIISGVLNFVFGMILSYEKSYTQAKMADALKFLGLTGLVMGATSGVANVIGNVIASSVQTSSYLYSYYYGSVNVVSSFVSGFIYNGLFVTTLVLIGGGVFSMFVNKATLPKELNGAFDSLKKILLG